MWVQSLRRSSTHSVSGSIEMSYIDGFVIAVPKGNRQKFIEHAQRADALFVEYGARRLLECWEDDVKEGKFGLSSRGAGEG